MVRLHKKENGQYLVSCKRVSRGYVVRSKMLVEKRRYDRRMAFTDGGRMVEAWYPMSLDGSVIGKKYDTQKMAVSALMSLMEFHLDNFKGKR